MWFVPSRELPLQPDRERGSLHGGDGVPSAIRPGDRAQPQVLGQHQRPRVRLHQRRRPGHGRQLPGGPCQVSALRGSRRGVPGRAAVRMSTVRPHVSSGRDRARLLDGSFPSGPGTRGDDLPRFEWDLFHSRKLRPAAHRRHL